MSISVALIALSKVFRAACFPTLLGYADQKRANAMSFGRRLTFDGDIDGDVFISSASASASAGASASDRLSGHTGAPVQKGSPA